MDGLCGIYCLVHFLERAEKLSAKGRTKAHSAFAELLKDAEAIGLLKASNIIAGYYAEDLANIFNKTAKRKRLPFVARELTLVVDAAECESGTTLLRMIFEEGGAAIVSVNAGQHWVLAEGIGNDTQILVADSGHHEKYRKEQLKRLSNSYDGVALLPRRSSLARASA